MARLSAMLKTSVRTVADHLWPPVCIACETSIQDTHALCSLCWEKLNFLSAPQCHACGVPFPYEVGAEALCVACTRERPAYRHARAAVVYDDASKGMILAFKHGDRTDLAPALTKLILRPARPLLESADIIVPVPLHWSRLISRRYNQAGLIANRLARLNNVQSVPDILERVRRTGTQGGKSSAARHRNVQGAFRVNSRYGNSLQGLNVLLVDDVLTTGATVQAAAKALLRGGAEYVDVITIARVVTSGL